MFARAILSFLPACPERSRRVLLPACPQNSLSPIIPLRLSPAPFERFAVSLVIPAHPRYPGEGGYTGYFVGPSRRALSAETRLAALFPFNHLGTLSFSVARLSPVSPALSGLFPKKPGGTPSGPTSRTHSHPLGSFTFRVMEHGPRYLFAGHWSPAASSPILPSR
jgi:hypothetical protein